MTYWTYFKENTVYLISKGVFYGFILVALNTLMFWSCANPSSPKNSKIIAKYETVTESEWNVNLILYDDNTATLIRERWNPGDYKNRDKEIIHARYAIEKKVLLLKYNKTRHRLEMVEELSLEIFGKKGHAPGLKPIDSPSKQPFWGQYLWNFSRKIE